MYVVYVLCTVDLLDSLDRTSQFIKSTSWQYTHTHLEPSRHNSTTTMFTETQPEHWRTRKQYSTQVTRLPHRGAC